MEVALLLLLGGLVELGEAGRSEHAVAGRVEASAMLRHLHRHERAGDQIDAGAAVLGWNVEAPETHLAHFSGEALKVFAGIEVHWQCPSIGRAAAPLMREVVSGEWPDGAFSDADQCLVRHFTTHHL